MTRLRPYWIVGVIVAGLAGWGGVTLAEHPAFHLKKLDVIGLAHLSRGEIVSRAAIDPHRNIWLLDTRAIEGRLEAIPYVKTARVHRRPPATIWLEIFERVPAACVRAGPNDALIDAENRVLETDCPRGDLPAYVLGASLSFSAGAFLHDELAQLEDDANVIAAAASARFVSFAHDRFGQLVATRDDGISVQFGDEDELTRKQQLVGPILAELGPRAAQVTSVDVRTPATPVVEYRPERPAIHRSPQASDSE